MLVLGFFRAGTARVYNVAVEGHHEFYAEGVLTSNCDALRYGLMRDNWEPPEVEKEVDLVNTPVHRLSPEQLMARYVEEVRIKQTRQQILEDQEDTLYADSLLHDLGVQDTGLYGYDDDYPVWGV